MQCTIHPHHYRTNVKPLPQRNENGFGGFGYGGDRLYLAYVADCFAPAVYAIRSDTLEDAYEVAEASLAPLVDLDDLDENELAALLDGCPTWGTFAADGSIVDTEALQLVEWNPTR